MKRPLHILSLSLSILFLSISCSNSQTLKCTRVIDGDVTKAFSLDHLFSLIYKKIILIIVRCYKHFLF